jgi:uncharacterized protein YndB with AHSA1/START domain
MVDVIRTHTFEAPIDRVWAMFTDPASHIAKFEAMGHRNVEILEEDHSDGLRLVVTREVDLDVPGFAKKFIKPTNTLVSTDHWRDRGDGTYGGEFIAETKGAPVDVRGTTLIEPDGDRTRYTVTTTIKVNVPLVGGKIADFSKGIVNRQMDDEFRLGDQWLANH